MQTTPTNNKHSKLKTELKHKPQVQKCRKGKGEISKANMAEAKKGNRI